MGDAEQHRSLAELRASVGSARAALENALAAVDHLAEMLETCGLDLPEVDRSLAVKRRVNRRRKIDMDPELHAFVDARIERLPYTTLAKQIAAHFPAARRIGKSALHTYHVRERARRA
ncbi:hypothetical protein [Pseudaestuariivita sp.]|uniref:hypothetical protein n=1 Tax=Pseudaestuariivita sp. TaxID=2211669 RepID=UPI0040589C5F